MNIQTESGTRIVSDEGTLPSLAGSAEEVVAGALDRVVLGNPLSGWIVFAAVFVSLLVVAWLVRAVLAARLKRWADRTTTTVDDLVVTLVQDIRMPLIAPGLLAFAARGLALPPQLEKGLHIVGMLGLVLQLVVSSRLVIDYGLNALLNRHKGSDGRPDPTLASSLSVLRVLSMMAVASVLVLLALDNLGVEIKPLLAGLGIGGIAIALAVQSVLGDLFGSLTILLDKPFVVGDFITIGDKMGTVEQIGIKTTRVKALSGEQLVFSNSDLLAGRLHNFKRMTERRAVFTVSVTYDTPPQKLREIPVIIKTLIQSQPRTRFDRSHFKTLGSYSLDFETVYFICAPDMAVYLDIQQAVNLSLIEKFAAEGIEFAFPTAVEIQRTDDRPVVGPKAS